MKLYAHWLDSAYIKESKQMATRTSLPWTSSLDRVLKLNFLFGNEIVLNDVQIIDSSFVLEYFLDPQFRNFLREYPRLLHLVAKPQDQEPQRFSIATSGIRRSLVQGWISSAFDDTHPVIDLGQAILQTGRLDPSMQLAEDAPGTIGHIVRIKWPQYKNLLEGMLWAVNHFASEHYEAPTYPPSTNTQIQSYYDVLQNIAGKSFLEPKHEEYIEKTLNYIDTHVEDKRARHRRSAVYSTMDTQQQTKEQQIVWHTIIHAWNCAVQNTLGSDGGSIGNLPFSAPIGFYLDKPTDALVVPFNVNSSQQTPITARTRVSAMKWDPATLGWNEIREAIYKTSTTQDALKAALNTGDIYNIREAIEEHANKLGCCFEKPIIPKASPYVWVSAACAAVVIGNIEAAGYLIGATPVLYDSVEAFLRHSNRWSIANTLKESFYDLAAATALKKLEDNEKSPNHKD